MEIETCLALTCGARGVSIRMEMSSSELGVRVRISDVKRRQRKPPEPKAGGSGLSVAKGRPPGAICSWAVRSHCWGPAGDAAVFFYLILSESLPGIPDVLT